MKINESILQHRLFCHHSIKLWTKGICIMWLIITEKCMIKLEIYRKREMKEYCGLCKQWTESASFVNMKKAH